MIRSMKLLWRRITGKAPTMAESARYRVGHRISHARYTKEEDE